MNDQYPTNPGSNSYPNNQQPSGEYPGQYGAPGGAYPQTPPKKKNWFLRHKFLTALLAIVVIAIAATAGGGSKSSNDKTASSGSSAASSDSSAAAEKKDAESVPPMGTPVRDGKFEFTVTKVERNVRSVGDQYLGETAQGSYTLVHVRVKNVGTDAQTFGSTGQKAYDAQGIGYEADGPAAIYIPDNKTFLEQINPGNAVDGILVFDAPKGVTLTKVRLHDSLFSNGVETALSK